jgi:hypothetical protein
MKERRKNIMKKFGITGFIAVIVFNIMVGGWSVHQILSWFGKSIPTIADVAIGLFTAEFSVPVAIVGYVLKACGVF